MVLFFSVVVLADMTAQKRASETPKKKKFVHTFAARDCKGISMNSKNRCLANYCTQADGVEVYLIIGKKEYRDAVACFKNVFEPCNATCSAGSADTVSRRCNRLLNRCIRNR